MLKIYYIWLAEFGILSHVCENDLVIKANLEKVPFFNAPLYLENKEPIGKVDEIFGPIREYVKIALVVLLT